MFKRHFVTIGSYVNGKITLCDGTKESTEVLQTNEYRLEQIYWIAFSKIKSRILFGLGEIRLGFQILEAVLNPKDQEFIQNISHIHVLINGIRQTLQEMDQMKDKIRFSLGTFPLIEPSFNSSFII